MLFAPRLAAFLVDGLIADVVAVVAGWRPGQAGYGVATYLIFLAIELIFLAFAGQTPGMRLARIAVVRATDGRRPGIGWVVVRTLLLATVVPALIPDSTGRCMHDRAAGTTIVKTDATG